MATDGSVEERTHEEKLERIRTLDQPLSAIERFLESRDKEVPTRNDRFKSEVANRLSSDEVKELVSQYKYAGRQTLNYFIVEDINKLRLSDIREKVESRLPKQEDIDTPPVYKRPFLAETEQVGPRLYLAIAYYEEADSEDPATGKREQVSVTTRAVVVIHEDRDLVEIRGSDVDMVEYIRNEVCDAIENYRPDERRRANFGAEFQKVFNETVETYYNVQVRVDDQKGTTLDTIHFTSREDDEGNRQDARQDERVRTELDERGGEITRGYVELSEGLRFRINREQGKLSFTKAEMEDNINGVTEVVHDVLQQTGEYSRGEVSGLSDVPE